MNDDDQDFAATPSAIAAALATADIRIDPKMIDVLQRDDCVAVQLPDDRMAWFPLNAKGKVRLDGEARVLDLLARYCTTLTVPVVERVSDNGWQLRRSVSGISDPVATYRRAIEDPDFAAALGAEIGLVLASLHLAVPAAQLGWLPARPSWPAPRSEIARDLPLVVGDDAPLIARLLSIIERYEAEADLPDPVLLHADLGFHNMVVDLADGSLSGLFDFDDAAFGDRHHDFKYLLLDVPEETLLNAAIAAYCSAGGAPIDPRRVRLLNAASAVGFLAFRAGHAPDARPAGRTLAEDLKWVSLALSRLEAP